MVWLIGTDEAGYGPKLGPLVVVVTAWEADDRHADADLFDLLSGGVVRYCKASDDAAGDVPPAHSAGPTDDADDPNNGTSDAVPLTIADSKVLYQAGGSLCALELGTLTALRLLGRQPQRWSELLDALAPDDAAGWSSAPWYTEFDGPLPADTTATSIDCCATRLSEVCQRAGVRLAAVRARAIHPVEFNQDVEHCGSKGEYLSRVTLDLVSWACRQAGDQTCRVVCDKHGGRNRYGGLLNERLTDEWIWTVDEGRACSRYQWGGRHQIDFRAGGERYLPSGLASMIAKYLREQLMRAWNAYWLALSPDLRPTAGYPGDAQRFLDSIRPLLAQTGVSLQQIWRNR
jgi:hypothetical protein